MITTPPQKHWPNHMRYFRFINLACTWQSKNDLRSDSQALLKTQKKTKLAARKASQAKKHYSTVYLRVWKTKINRMPRARH